MPDQSKSNPPDGRVVYRRVTPADQDSPARADEPRLDPALLPLVAGFALLLLLILVLGNLSVRRLEETSRESLEIEHHHAALTTVLLQMRVALTRLDNEARDRMEAEARHELTPILDLRLSTARNKVKDLGPLLDHPPLSELPKWRAFRADLAAYDEITRDRNRYSQEGYAKFRDVDAKLDDLLRDAALEQDQIFQRREAMQTAATRAIRTWNIIAILAGLAVAVATIWQVQRRFRQTRLSTESARREREFSNQILEGMVSAIAAIDRHDRIRSANTAFFRIFPGATVGASIHDQVASPQGVKLLEAATASHVETATYRGRWALNENGAAHSFDVYSSPVEIDNQHGQILTLVEVTEAAKAEIALRRSEALAAVGEAAAQLAHEIKNPLGSIRLGVEMLLDHAVSDDAIKTITLVERGINHLNKLVVDVTQFSRRRHLDLSEVGLHVLIDSSIDLVADRVLEKKTPIEKNYSASPISGRWDDEQLREVFVNLLANAIDAGALESPVEIATEFMKADETPKTIDAAKPGRADHARITITDHGSGMDAKIRARLFEPFCTTKKRGTGLGLSIVRQIIELHGGRIEVQSEPAKGTSVQIELPLESRDSR